MGNGDLYYLYMGGPGQNLGRGLIKMSIKLKNNVFLDTPVAKVVKDTEKRNPQSFLSWGAQKRKSFFTTGKKQDCPVEKKRRKEVVSISNSKDKPNPHICLQCGSELSRGREFNKKRHWLQKHSDQPEKGYEKQIVPKDHEHARKLLTERAKEMSSATSPSTGTNDAGENSNQTISSTMKTYTTTTSSQDDRNKKDGGPGTVQKSLQSFLVAEKKAEVSPVEQMQGDVNRILVMLEALTIPEKDKEIKAVNVNHDVTAIITASNLLEVKHPDIIVDILEDGCKITCHPCQQFQLAQQKDL